MKILNLLWAWMLLPGATAEVLAVDAMTTETATARVDTAEDCGCHEDSAGLDGAAFGPESELEARIASGSGDRVRLELFVMSLCPYGM